MASPEGRFFCAAAARERGDPIAGTAPRGQHWVLIEYRGAWPTNGFDGLELRPGVRDTVFAAAARLRARILLIRRYGQGRRQPPEEAAWAVLHRDPDGGLHQRWGVWRDDHDLLGIATALDSGITDDTLGTASPSDPVVLVCTHARHDACCAVRGRPVARVLDERWPGMVWECTHVGGDRFAANVLVVPDGVYYGLLDETDPVRVIADHLADRIGPEFLRGYTDLTPAEQVAVVAALRTKGPAGRNDWIVTGVQRDEHRWRVQLRGRRPELGALQVQLVAERTPPRQLTCSGPSTAQAIEYVVDGVEELPSW